MSVSCHFRLGSFQSWPHLQLHYSLDDIKNLNEVRDQKFIITGKAEECSWTAAIRNRANHTSETVAIDYDSSRKSVRLQVDKKHMWTIWIDKRELINNKLTSFLWTPYKNTIGFQLFSGWDSVSAFSAMRNHGVPTFLQREHSYLTNVFWA